MQLISFPFSIFVDWEAGAGGLLHCRSVEDQIAT